MPEEAVIERPTPPPLEEAQNKRLKEKRNIMQLNIQKRKEEKMMRKFIVQFMNIKAPLLRPSFDSSLLKHSIDTPTHTHTP